MSDEQLEEKVRLLATEVSRLGQEVIRLRRERDAALVNWDALRREVERGCWSVDRGVVELVLEFRDETPARVVDVPGCTCASNLSAAVSPCAACVRYFDLDLDPDWVGRSDV